MNLFKTKNKNYVLAIIDDRTGNRNQVFAILKELKLPYKILDVKYNWLAKFPNCILQVFGGLMHIKDLKIEKIKANPTLILSCGRRTFPLASKLKYLFTGYPYFVHLMYPRFSLNLNKCNLIFTPCHDNIKKKDNIINTLGSPAPLNILKNINNPYNSKPITLLLIGGNHGKYILKSDTIRFLINEILKKNYKGSVLISTSRRTPNKVIKAIDSLAKNNPKIKNIFHPKKDYKKNPLKELIHFANELVVTGDSISMISELCQYKKPVRIFFNEKFCSPKHINFCKKLIHEGYAYPFETFLKKCNKIKTINTTKKISRKILGKINNEKNKL